MRIELAIHERHLKFVLVIAHSADAAQHSRGVLPPCVVDEQPFKCVHVDIRQVGDPLFQHVCSFRQRKQWGLLGILENRHYELIEYLAAPVDKVEMTVRKGVESAWIDRYDVLQRTSAEAKVPGSANQNCMPLIPQRQGIHATAQAAPA